MRGHCPGAAGFETTEPEFQPGVISSREDRGPRGLLGMPPLTPPVDGRAGGTHSCPQGAKEQGATATGGSGPSKGWVFPASSPAMGSRSRKPSAGSQTPRPQVSSSPSALWSKAKRRPISQAPWHPGPSGSGSSRSSRVREAWASLGRRAVALGQLQGPSPEAAGGSWRRRRRDSESPQRPGSSVTRSTQFRSVPGAQGHAGGQGVRARLWHLPDHLASWVCGTPNVGHRHGAQRASLRESARVGRCRGVLSPLPEPLRQPLVGAATGSQLPCGSVSRRKGF